MRLSTAKKIVGNFSGVGNAWKRDFLGEGRSGRRGKSGGLSKWNGGRIERKKKSEQ